MLGFVDNKELLKNLLKRYQATQTNNLEYRESYKLKLLYKTVLKK